MIVITAVFKNLPLKHYINFVTFIFSFYMCAIFMLNYMTDYDLRSGGQPVIKLCQGAGSQPNGLDKCLIVLLLYHDPEFTEDCFLQKTPKILDFACTLFTILQKASLYVRPCFWTDMLLIYGQCRVS